MKAVRVQYVVQEDYVEQNKANVRAVMEDLRNNPIQGMTYSTFYLGDGKFMHQNYSDNEEALAKFNELESFGKFRMELKASGPIQPPKSEDMEYVGSNNDLI